MLIRGDALKPGVYIVAVSGGVDSVVLLDMLSKQHDLELVVAHFDHGIRSDSLDDRKFVATLSQKYKLPFEYAEGNLGPGASEAKAREARYKFLRQSCKKYRAQAIITAHHQDDVIETMIINLLRGTRRKGLTALSSTGDVIRPLLNVPKISLIEYAKKYKLEWHEDSTNTQTDYLRNWVRLRVVPKLTAAQRRQLLQTYQMLIDKNIEIDTILGNFFDGKSLARKQLIDVPHQVALELVAVWLRANGLRNFDTKTLDRLVIGAKTLKPGGKIDVKQGIIKVQKHNLVIDLR